MYYVQILPVHYSLESFVQLTDRLFICTLKCTDLKDFSENN
jgi:hypothetical protein